MSDRQEIQRDTWERFVDFLYPCGETMTTSEVDDCVNEFGIDIGPGFVRFQELIERRRRQVRLEQASQRRECLQRRLTGLVAPKFDDLKERVRGLVESSGDKEKRLAYFYKLERAESETDLQSLLDDLEKLEAIRDFDDEA